MSPPGPWEPAEARAHAVAMPWNLAGTIASLEYVTTNLELTSEGELAGLFDVLEAATLRVFRELKRRRALGLQ